MPRALVEALISLTDSPLCLFRLGPGPRQMLSGRNVEVRRLPSMDS
jgi:hypothetical protein